MRLFNAAALACILAATVVTGSARASDDDVIARVGNTDVTAKDVRNYVATLDPRAQVEIIQNPALLARSVRMYIAQQLLLKEALAKKWDQQPAVAAQLDRVRQGAVTQMYLQSVSQPPANFPTDAQVQNTYDANKTTFLVARQFHLAQIVVADPRNAGKAADDKAHQKLIDIQKKLHPRNADFAAIAQASSDEPQSAKAGGDIGWVAENQMVPEIKTVALGLAKGSVSEPLRLDDGWHIIKLIDTKAAFTRPLSDAAVHAYVVQQLREQQANTNGQAYLGKLLQQNQPAVDEIALSKIFQKQTTAATQH